MKKPKINLSKESLSSFFLHHIEKVILGLAILGMAFFLYNGWSTENFTKSSPKKLSDDAARAKAHITKASAWDEIEQFRAADLDAHKRIEDASERKLNPDDYNVGALTGSPTATMSKRLDPILVAPENLVAQSVLAPILITNQPSQIDNLPQVQRGGSGSSARGATQNEFEDDDERPRPRGKKAAVEVVEEFPFGDHFPDVMLRETVGLRTHGSTNGNRAGGGPLVREFIAVKGVVNFKKQYEQYEAAFRNAVGYYPLRDRPQILYMEVQRRQVGQDDWMDISERFAAAENVYGVESPEVIDPDYFHPVTVRPSPPLAATDIRSIATHPDVPLRKMVPDSFAKRNKAEPGSGTKGFDEDELGGLQDDEMAEKEVGMLGNDNTLYQNVDLIRAPKADTKLLRFFDLTAVRGSAYRYRVRLWLNDPNDPAGFNKAGVGVKNMIPMGRMDPEDMMDDGSGLKNKEELEDLSVYAFRMISGSMQSQEVRQRIRAKREQLVVPEFNFSNRLSAEDRELRLAQLTQLLSSGWPTEWSEPTAPVTCAGAEANFFAGSIEQPATVKVDDIEFPRGEGKGDLVISQWSRTLDILVSGFRNVSRGDMLNFDVNATHVVHPGDGSVRLLVNQEIRSNALVVDLMGGELVPGDFKLPVNMPGEILVMQSDGSLSLQNNYDDLRGYRHALLLEDEEPTFGEVAEEKRNPRNRRGNRNQDDFEDEEFDF